MKIKLLKRIKKRFTVIHSGKGFTGVIILLDHKEQRRNECHSMQDAIEHMLCKVTSYSGPFSLLGYRERVGKRRRRSEYKSSIRNYKIKI